MRCNGVPHSVFQGRQGGAGRGLVGPGHGGSWHGRQGVMGIARHGEAGQAGLVTAWQGRAGQARYGVVRR